MRGQFVKPLQAVLLGNRVVTQVNPTKCLGIEIDSDLNKNVYVKEFVAAPVFRPFLRHVCVADFCSCALVLLLLTTRSDARARKGVSFYLSACRFPVFLYTNCTSVYLV